MTLNDIKPYEKNAKKHPDQQIEKLAAIVKEVGWRQPVLVNQAGVIVAGHGRWATWLQHKDTHNLKPIWIIDDKGNTVHGAPDNTPLTPEQEKAYRLADNKLNESDWDITLVTTELGELPQAMIDLTGFSKELVLSDEGLGGAAGGDGFSLPDGDKGEFEQITFSLSAFQAKMVKEAIAKAKRDSGDTEDNKNSNGNALAYIAERYLDDE